MSFVVSKLTLGPDYVDSFLPACLLQISNFVCNRSTDIRYVGPSRTSVQTLMWHLAEKLPPFPS
jgi:hypothetical protein